MNGRHSPKPLSALGALALPPGLQNKASQAERLAGGAANSKLKILSLSAARAATAPSSPTRVSTPHSLCLLASFSTSSPPRKADGNEPFTVLQSREPTQARPGDSLCRETMVQLCRGSKCKELLYSNSLTLCVGLNRWFSTPSLDSSPPWKMLAPSFHFFSD